MLLKIILYFGMAIVVVVVVVVAMEVYRCEVARRVKVRPGGADRDTGERDTVWKSETFLFLQTHLIVILMNGLCLINYSHSI